MQTMRFLLSWPILWQHGWGSNHVRGERSSAGTLFAVVRLAYTANIRIFIKGRLDEILTILLGRMAHYQGNGAEGWYGEVRRMRISGLLRA